MKLLSPNRDGAILLAFFIGLGLCAKLPESIAETTPVQGSTQADKAEDKKVTAHIFQIKNLKLEEAKEKIKGLLSKDSQVGASVEELTFMRSGEELKFLVVTDTPLKIQEISQVIEELEKKFAPATVDLDFVDAPLSQLLTTIGQVADLNIIGGETLSEKISVHLKSVPLTDVFDIILNSTPYTYIKEKGVIRIITKEELPLVTEALELQFISAEQIKEAVSSLISKQGSVKAFSKFSEGKYANFLIVTDSLESLKVIREVVKTLDRKLRQVAIEAKFCEVTLDKDDQLGIDWVIQASLTGAKGPTTFPLGKSGSRIIEQPETLTSTSGSITLGTMSFADFTATLHALDTKTKVKLIATPQVAAMDGQEAEIIIGKKVPIPLYERNRDTGTMEVTGYQIEDIGTVLKVTPIINNDNTVTLKIHPEVSEIASYTGPNNERPIISSREITTVFTIEDGKTIVLGGLMQQKLTNTSKQVPVIANIPVLGNLFKYRNDSDERTELLIFITPRILKETSAKKDIVSDKGQGKK